MAFAPSNVPLFYTFAVPFLAFHSECPCAGGIRTFLLLNIQFHRMACGVIIYLLFYRVLILNATMWSLMVFLVFAFHSNLGPWPYIIVVISPVFVEYLLTCRWLKPGGE
jgi:hypothetical protein